MNSNILKPAIGVAVLVIAIAASAFYITNHKQPVTVTTKPVSTVTSPPVANPCTATKPCIELLDSKNKVFAKINDFQFGKQGCIKYRVLTTDPYQQHCGGYSFRWIGPDPTPGVASKP